MAKVSRNRSDYPGKVQLIIHGMADVFYGGDLDAAWEAFFTKMETDPVSNYRRKEAPDGEARISLRVPHQDKTW